MKTLLFKSLIILMLSFATYSPLFALGSYMFCVNKNNSNDWKWAPPLKDGLYLDAPFVPPNRYGTWIYGYGGLFYNKLHSCLYADIYSTYGTHQGARKLCTELANVCTNAYGPDYSQIGVSGYAVAPGSWSFIVMVTMAGGYVCPNWVYPDGFDY